MSEHHCPVCGATKNIFALCEVNAFSIYCCKSCGADHVHPMPSSQTLKTYYDREEWFEGGEAGGYRNYDEQTAWSVDAIKPALDAFGETKDLSVLDVGCGYGTHLDLAASRGWKCFGVEVSAHARKIAQKRLGSKAYVVESVADLIPHEFDLILILDVIEHLPSPYALFYSLFSIGAITPKTRIIISTPNAETEEARTKPAEWSFRHPPSHLVYYSANSLKFFLEKLHFSNVQIQGVHPLQLSHATANDLVNHAGLLVSAQGSNFTEFMRERYVPGTWSKIAAYEHLPRYALAKLQVAGKNVLDFGCGTGYGSAMLSELAASVTGLDIDDAAIAWARSTHVDSKLAFHLCNDLGVTLAKKSFDVVTCFEMIEHVDYETQQAVIASIARLLRDTGILIISTPNPEITKLYGANPYHLREMNLSEFHELLGTHFSHIQILSQRVQNSIAFNETTTMGSNGFHSLDKTGTDVLALAFIAICSNEAILDVKSMVMFDEDTDVIQEYMTGIKKLDELRLTVYSQGEALNASTAIRTSEITNLNAVLNSKDVALSSQALEITRLYAALDVKDIAISSQASEITRLHAVFDAKEVAITFQADEIARLHAAYDAKEVAITSQADEIARLHAAFDAKEIAISSQASEIARLHAVFDAKEVAITSQAQEITRLHGVFDAKEVAITSQAQEITRLHGVFDAKEVAITSQAQEITRLHGAFDAKEVAIASQAHEITRLNEAFASKEAVVATLIPEIGQLTREHEILHQNISQLKNEVDSITHKKWYRFGKLLKLC